MNTLQKSLMANGLFSSLSALLLILFPVQVSGIFGLEAVPVFRGIGFVLLLFAVLVFWQSQRQDPMGVLSIIFQDDLWVLASLILLILNPFGVSSEGNLLIGTIALIVMTFAILQSRALAQLDASTSKGGKWLAFSREIHAPSQRVWREISDVGNYHHAASSIDHVSILEGEGIGMKRECQQGDRNWTESCVLWEEGRAYEFEVDTQAADYPFPLSYLKGRWEVESLTEKKSLIKMTFDLRFKKPWQNLLLYPVMKGGFVKQGEELLDNWEKMMKE